MRANIGAKSHRGLPRDCLGVPNGLPVRYMWHVMTIANRCMKVCTNRLLTNHCLLSGSTRRAPLELELLCSSHASANTQCGRMRTGTACSSGRKGLLPTCTQSMQRITVVSLCWLDVVLYTITSPKHVGQHTYHVSCSKLAANNVQHGSRAYRCKSVYNCM